jgi:hypothetical protein
MDSEDKDLINLIICHGLVLGKDAPSDNPLTKCEAIEFLKLIHSNRDAKMFSIGYLYGLTAANAGISIKSEKIREAHQATLDYLATIECLVKKDG